jgi:hypothetical protein
MTKLVLLHLLVWVDQLTYKVATFLNKWLTNTLQLQNTYVTHNSTQLAHRLNKLQITESNRMVTFDVKVLYVNIPRHETINVTKILLTNTNVDNTLILQAFTLLSTILKQNHLQFNNKFYQPNLGGLVVSVLATGPKVRGFDPGRGRWIFFKGDKNPEHHFLRRGSKAVGPMS